MPNNRNRSRAARPERVYVPCRIRHANGGISEVSAGEYLIHTGIGNLIRTADDHRLADVKPGLICWSSNSDGKLNFFPVSTPEPTPPDGPSIPSFWPTVERVLLMLRGRPAGYEGAWPITKAA